MNLCIIPARGGSKRIPRKNIRPFLGRPIIGYSIEAAQEAKCFDRIWVSTDDQEIAGIAAREGAEIPFMRPRDLADDLTGTNAVVKHAIDYSRQQGLEVTVVCCLYPTAPFLKPEYLTEGLSCLRKGKYDFVTTVAEFNYPIQRALRRDQSGRITLLDHALASARSQDLEPAYHDAGQAYWGWPDSFAMNATVFDGDCFGLVLPRERVQDIDTLEDWEYAEAMFRVLASEYRSC